MCMKKLMAGLLMLLAVLLAMPAKTYADEPGDGAGTAFNYATPVPDNEPVTANLDPGPPDPEDTPIDGGLALLLAAGALYGLHKYRNAQPRQQAYTGGVAVARG